MISRYCLPEILALGALLVHIQGCSAAFNYGPAVSDCKSSSYRRMSTAPAVRGSSTATDNRMINNLRTRNLPSLFATTDGDQEEVSASTSKGVSKRKRVLNMLGLRLGSPSETTEASTTEEETGPYHITSMDELNDYYNDDNGRFRKNKTNNGEIDYTAMLAALDVKGDTQLIGSPNHKDKIHPVVQMVHDRRRKIETIKAAESAADSSSDTVTTSSTTVTNKRNVHRTLPPEDNYRVALAVEGGGMRGCVTGGMVAAIHHLGLEDTVDCVYGSSAGTVIGAYFITRQLPWFGPELYYDCLTTAGKGFINTKRFFRAVGLGLLDPRLLKDVIFRRNHGKPVLNLNYLLNTTMQENKPLDWETFEEMQKVQPLKIMASGLKSQRAFIMDMERGSFSTIEEMARCMMASCLLPGVAGPVMNMKSPGKDGKQQYDMKPRNKQKGDDYEPLADSLVFEPLPYRAAISEGATHVICLRSRPDGVDVTGKSSIFERMIVRRFFLRKNNLRKAYNYMSKHFHKRLYAEQVLETNAAANDMDRPYSDIDRPHVLPIAVPPGSAEVGRLETGREAIFDGVRRGFARCYDALVEDPEQRGKGMEVAMKVFPDDILNYDPDLFTSKTESAYAAYLKSK